MTYKITNLIKKQQIFLDARDKILSKWKDDNYLKDIRKDNSKEKNIFINNYAEGVFDYFFGVISSKVKLGECPVMQNLLVYLREKNIKADELFDMCGHFRRSIISFTYDVGIDSEELFNEITYIFDQNFKSILQFYTDTISIKEKEVDRSSKLLSEYKMALDNSALISKTDLNGHITYVNDKLVNLCEYSEAELIGERHNIMKHEDMSHEYFRSLWEELKQNNIFKGTIKNCKKNGQYFYIDVTIVKISDPFDDSSEYMSIAYDVTKFVDARIDALQAGKAKEYFLSNMSHEIRTPLNAILGFINLMLEDPLSKKHRKYLDIIFNSGENLLSIINDILDFSKLRTGEFTIEPKVFSIHDELSHALELFVPSANSKNITITSFIDPTIPTELFADPLRITQILSNFISNAIKFTHSGGIISVEASCENMMLKIRVKDNGIGISKEDIKNIFTAFAQAQHSKNKKNDGTGLGLAICQQLAEHMEGTVSANSLIGKGSTFWLNIPVKINNSECLIFNEVSEFKDIKIVVYSKDEDSLHKHEAFLKYSSIFGMNTTLVDTLDVNFNVAILIYEDMSEEQKNSIINSDKKFIVIMRRGYDDFDKYPHIMPISFPLYCSKIRLAFLELFNPQQSIPHTKKISKKFEGHVLIAEDNEANQELIKILLKKYGLSFDLANNGLEALELYKLNKYDLILMDEQMPVMNGYETVKAILDYEKNNNLNHTPISALTANVVQESKFDMSSAYDSFLGKPIVLSEIEKVFSLYLNKGFSDITAVDIKENDSINISGIDIDKLIKELMLNKDELLMLLKLFIKKMNKLLPDLNDAIAKRDYKKIGLISHSIKGSSGNFRIEVLQKISSEMETMAKNKNEDYLYEKMFEKIKCRIGEINIS